MLHPVEVGKLGERRRRSRIRRERKVGRRDNAYDESYGGTTGFLKEGVRIKRGKRGEEDTLRVGGEAMILGGVERMR